MWDFAGDGYVHSLILKDSSLLQLHNDEDSTTLLTPFHTEQRNLWLERGVLGADPESSVVSAKLEAAARHYNQLLAWQMEQNRLLYETRLQRIRDSMPDPNVSGPAGTSRGNPAISGISAAHFKTAGATPNKAEKGPRASSWRENMLVSLRSERGKVARQLEGAQERLARACKEVDMLKELHVGLTGNKAEWQRRVDAATLALKEQESAHK